MQVAQTANYRIIVEGVLDPVWLECFGGLAITEERQPGRPAITRLEGRPTDEAALQGVLRAARLERDSRRTAQLAEVVAALGACTEEREIAERVTGFAVSLLEAQDAVLRLREEPSGRYRIAAWSGVGEWRKAALAELERKLATDALRDRRVVRVAGFTGAAADGCAPVGRMFG